MDIETAKKQVNSTIKKYKLERRKDTLIMFPFYQIEVTLYGCALVCNCNDMTNASQIIGILTTLLVIPTSIYTVKEYKRHKLTNEINNLKRIKSFLDKDINILEHVEVEKFDKTKKLKYK